MDLNHTRLPIPPYLHILPLKRPALDDLLIIALYGVLVNQNLRIFFKKLKISRVL